MKTFETVTRNIDERWEKLPQDVRNLIAKLQELPPEFQEKLEPFVDDMVRGTQRRREIFAQIQESVTQLRLDMKYLIFDLEATRRERDANQIQ
ncbi:MAG: transcriptional regulator [Planctomycetia bacterium]|nr:transcriptional regulator [Planctomycetia bacterium]